jgi:NAD(P)-dependent dehydrogenase (short-subunit alcohol dehydrogenase family)
MTVGQARHSGDDHEFQETAMNYFVTGATGFIGKRLVKKLLGRPEATVYFLTRAVELPRLAGIVRVLGQ